MPGYENLVSPGEAMFTITRVNPGRPEEDHKTKVRRIMKKIAHIHRAALKLLADGATPPPPPASPPDKE
jgi:hypothetical protein